MSEPAIQSLEQQRQDFANRRFLAMPLTGAIVWSVIGIAGIFLSPTAAVWVLFIGTGMIVYLGMFISKFTGEDFLDKSRPKNTFDSLFYQTVIMSVLVYSIAIPFFLADYTSLPLSVGILSGLMWVPLSWVLQHWIGYFHGIGRTVLVLAAWYLFPDYRFVVIPFVIVGIYIITIVVLEKRWKQLN